MHKTRIDLSEKIREKINQLIQANLADCIDLITQSKQAHWTVKGMNFIALHELFDKISEDFAEHADLLAERIAQLGGSALGTARVVAQTSGLPEYPLNITSGKDHVTALATAVAAFGRSVRNAIDQSGDLKDLGTADLFTEISRAVDKDLWLLEAHLQAKTE